MDRFIEFDRITKRFGGVVALDEVSLAVRRGECHGLMGENGAGKSTLGKVLAGVHRADSGTVRLDGSPLRLNTPADARAAGVGMVHQELATCGDLSVAENLAMGAYPARARFWLDHRAMIANAERLIARVGLSVDVRAPMRELSVAQEQMVQVAAALAGGGRALIFDEPTSSLSVIESQRLFALIEELRRAGVTMLYVSHRMPEVFRLCDRISVLRDGRHVATVARADTSEREIVQMMVGREVVPNARRGGEPPLADTPPALGVRGLTSPGRFGDITFEVRPGEIVGVAGLVGSGRSEVAQAIFGLDRSARGEVKVAGEPVRLGRVRHAMRCGVALVPEDRKRQGLVMGMSCVANHTLANLASLSRWGWLMHGRAWRDADGYFKRLALKAPSWDAAVHTLSGGNQQKVVLSKWLCRGAKVLIVDEPTRGVDVAAKASIHSLLRELAGGGVAVLMISSELPEVLSLADRVLVMRGGRLVGELPGMHATEESVLRLMVGVG